MLLRLLPLACLALVACGPECPDGSEPALWFADLDGDGHGDPESTQEACEAPWAHVASADDCDDADPDIAPGRIDDCNDLDDDCDGAVDEDGVDEQLFFDADGDGYGSRVSWTGCGPPPNIAYRATNDDDCDDLDRDRRPLAPERCNGLDDDCDGDVDENPSDTVRQYLDDDGDGYGLTSRPVDACPGAPGVSELPGDCDDDDAQVSPGAEERCNGLDDDCDQLTDEQPADGAMFWIDLDQDGWGGSKTASACAPGLALVPAGDVFGYAATPPGFAYYYYGFLTEVTVSDSGGDCNDANSLVYPGGLERCDGLDNNCSGFIDDNDPALAQSEANRYHLDIDGDGYGRNDVAAFACTAPFTFVSLDGDCDDDDEDVNPAAEERCDGVDNDCNGLIDRSDLGPGGCP